MLEKRCFFWIQKNLKKNEETEKRSQKNNSNPKHKDY